MGKYNTRNGGVKNREMGEKHARTTGICKTDVRTDGNNARLDLKRSFKFEKISKCCLEQQIVYSLFCFMTF